MIKQILLFKFVKIVNYLCVSVLNKLTNKKIITQFDGYQNGDLNEFIFIYIY